MAGMLGDECGRTQAQIEIDKLVAVLEDFLERSGRRNARAASHTTPNTKTKRAAAKPPAGGYDYCYDDEDNPLHWLSSAEDALPTPKDGRACPLLPIYVTSGSQSKAFASTSSDDFQPFALFLTLSPKFLIEVKSILLLLSRH
jgi:hypothetical protein